MFIIKKHLYYFSSNYYLITFNNYQFYVMFKMMKSDTSNFVILHSI